MDTGKLANNRLLETVLDSIPIPIFYKNEAGIYLGCNTAFESLFGVSRTFLTGKSVYEVFDREIAWKFSEMDQRLILNPGRQVYESAVFDSEGNRREVIFHKATFLHPDGKVAGVVGAILDATDLRATEKKLIGAKTSFHAVFDAIPDLLSVVDRDMRIMYSNWHGGHDYVSEEIRSKNPFCYEAYYPGRTEPCHPCHLLEVFRTGKPLITEKYNPRIGYLEIHAFPVLDETGNVMMAAEYLRNITDRKEAGDALQRANHMLEAIIYASPLAIIAFDNDDKLILWNNAAEEMFGWKRDEVLFKPYPIIPEDRIEEVRKNIRLLHKGEVFRSQETRRKRKDGSLVDVSLSTAVMPGPDGGVIGYMAIMSDITEKQNIKEERNRFEEKLIQANKMTALGTLASGIAHEINNPNNYMLSSTQFLREAWKDIERILLEYGRENGEFSIGGLSGREATDVIPKLLASLEEGSIRIKNIVENLKSFARQEKQSCHTLLDVNMAVHAAKNLLGNQIRKYTDSFSCDLAERLPKVRGSLQQIEQVIINLTMNALQSLPDKNSAVSISTFHDRNTQQVVIQVRDQGSGIPKELLRRIMEPFFTTKQDMGGTGLGLSICYSIVKKHQGTIECESDLNSGTTFSVKLQACGELS